MATIQKFEDLKAWQQARELNKTLLPLIKQLSVQQEYGLMNQLRNSSGSVMDNIAEGFDRGSRKEFVQFLGFAKGSIGEVKSQLYRAFDSDYLSKNFFDELYNLTDKIGKMLNGLITYLNNTDIKGERFKNRVNESTVLYGNKIDDNLAEIISNYYSLQALSPDDSQL